MMVSIANLFNDKQENIRGKVLALYVLLFVCNAAAWLWAIVAFHNYPVLLGKAALAYSFGLQHAFEGPGMVAARINDRGPRGGDPDGPDLRWLDRAFAQ